MRASAHGRLRILRELPLLEAANKKTERTLPITPLPQVSLGFRYISIQGTIGIVRVYALRGRYPWVSAVQEGPPFGEYAESLS